MYGWQGYTLHWRGLKFSADRLIFENIFCLKQVPKINAKYITIVTRSGNSYYPQG